VEKSMPLRIAVHTAAQAYREDIFGFRVREQLLARIMGGPTTEPAN
jgi:hypothetical protein